MITFEHLDEYTIINIPDSKIVAYVSIEPSVIGVYRLERMFVDGREIKLNGDEIQYTKNYKECLDNIVNFCKVYKID